MIRQYELLKWLYSLGYPNKKSQGQELNFFLYWCMSVGFLVFIVFEGVHLVECPSCLFLYWYITGHDQLAEIDIGTEEVIQDQEIGRGTGPGTDPEVTSTRNQNTKGGDVVQGKFFKVFKISVVISMTGMWTFGPLWIKQGPKADPLFVI